MIVGTGSATPAVALRGRVRARWSGMDVEVARILAKGLFWRSPRRWSSSSRRLDGCAIPNLLADKVGVVDSVHENVTAARAQLVDFTESYYREAITVLLLKDSPATAPSAEMAGQGHHRLRAAEPSHRGRRPRGDSRRR